MPFLLLFALMAVLELSVIIKVGAVVGVLNTVLLIFLTAAIGISVIMKQGARVMARAQQVAAEGKLPAQELGEALLLVVAAVFLFTPGFITDTAGFLLLIPPVRRYIAETTIGRKLAQQTYFRSTHFSGHTYDGESSSSEAGTTIEGEFHHIDKK